MKKPSHLCASWAVKIASHMEDLTPSDQSALQDHLAHCSSCAKLKADNEFVDKALEMLPAIPPSPKMLPYLLQVKRMQQRGLGGTELLGKQLGNYRLVQLLGHGGFADVYLGEHVYLKTTAAIKLLRTQIVQEANNVFEQEAQIIASLVHPHIVRVLDFAVEQDTPFLVMDYAPNGSLRQHHPRGKPLPLPTVVSYITQIADALQYAHDRNIVHRDIKPANMLLGRNGEVLLSDFGIAKLADSASSLLRVAGTAPYVAPEQRYVQLHPSVDQYSLGVVAYEWLCGERPFKGAQAEIIFKHRFDPPPPLRDKNPTISPAVEHVVLTALEKNPQKRFASVRAFAEELEWASRREAPQSRTVVPENIERGRTQKLNPSPSYHYATQEVAPGVAYSGVVPVFPNAYAPAVLQPVSSYNSPGMKVMVPQMRFFQKIGFLLSAALILLSSISLFNCFEFSYAEQVHTTVVATASSPSGRASQSHVVANRVASEPFPQSIYFQATDSTPILSDPLSDGNAGNWKAVDTQSYSCTFAEGAYLIQTKQRNSIGACLNRTNTFDDFAFQVDMILSSDGSGGITFVGNDKLTYLFEVNANSSYQFLILQDDHPEMVAASGNSSVIKMGLNQTNSMAVVFYGSTVYAYVNKHYIANIDNTSHMSGTIGLFAADSSTAQQTRALFKNAFMWRNSI